LNGGEREFHQVVAFFRPNVTKNGTLQTHAEAYRPSGLGLKIAATNGKLGAGKKQGREIFPADRFMSMPIRQRVRSRGQPHLI
jgi:hypothetical protein